MRSRFAWPLLIACAVLVVIACGSSNKGFGDDPSAGGDGGPTDPSLVFDSGLGDASAGGCGQCSSDLHALLDCNGQPIRTCPDDQGCSPQGGCVPACDSARANKSTIGCDYFAMAPVDYGTNRSCFAVFVANTWGSAVNLTVDRNGAPLNVASFAYQPQGSGSSITYTPLTGPLPAGGIAILFLSDDGASCPKTAATSGASFDGTGIGKAFHIASSAPVVAYDIFPYGGGSSAIASATLLLPTSAWGDNYVSLMAAPRTFADPWIGIVAQEDQTNVTISPTAAVVGGTGVAATGQGVPHTYTLQRGDILKLQQPTDLSGTPVQATKPVGVWAGNPCTNFPANVTACDGMHQQLPPVRALGSEYAAVQYRDRHPGTPEKSFWRLVGAVDGTTLAYDPPQAGAPATLASGQVVLYESGGPFVVKSQDDKHPFYMGEYMVGCSQYSGAGGGCRGDPEFVNVVPPQQFLASYIFFTDPTYPTTDLVFVRAKARDGNFKDVTLDCAGKLSGWQGFGSGKYEYTRFDLVKDNFAPQGACNNGRHEAKSDGPFGLTIWGWGESGTSIFSEACSYAYPAGMSVLPINTVTVPPVPR